MQSVFLNQSGSAFTVTGGRVPQQQGLDAWARGLAQRCAHCGPARSRHRAGGWSRAGWVEAGRGPGWWPYTEGGRAFLPCPPDPRFSAPPSSLHGSDSRSSWAKPISDPCRWETHAVSGGPVRVGPQVGEDETKTIVLGTRPFLRNRDPCYAQTYT